MYLLYPRFWWYFAPIASSQTNDKTAGLQHLGHALKGAKPVSLHENEVSLQATLFQGKRTQKGSDFCRLCPAHSLLGEGEQDWNLGTPRSTELTPKSHDEAQAPAKRGFAPPYLLLLAACRAGVAPVRLCSPFDPSTHSGQCKLRVAKTPPRGTSPRAPLTSANVYICSGAVIPMRPSVLASTALVAATSLSRALVSASSDETTRQSR